MAATNVAFTDTLNVVFGANFTERTGSLYEATYQWYGVPSYRRHNITTFAQADYRPLTRLKHYDGPSKTAATKPPGKEPPRTSQNRRTRDPDTDFHTE